MATVYGMLGQVSPAAGVLTLIYTVPALKHATIRIVAGNRSVADSFRISVSPNGAAIVNQHYLAYDRPIEAYESLGSAAVTVGSGDLVKVYSGNGNMSFAVTGIEEDD